MANVKAATTLVAKGEGYVFQNSTEFSFSEGPSSFAFNQSTAAGGIQFGFVYENGDFGFLFVDNTSPLQVGTYTNVMSWIEGDPPTGPRLTFVANGRGTSVGENFGFNIMEFTTDSGGNVTNAAIDFKGETDAGFGWMAGAFRLNSDVPIPDLSPPFMVPEPSVTLIAFLVPPLILALRRRR